MFHLHNTIAALFNNVSPELVISQLILKGVDERALIKHVNEEHLYAHTAFGGFQHLTNDEIEYVGQQLNNVWMKDRVNGQKHESSIFWLVHYFAEKVLTEQNDEPVVHFKQMLRWRILSHDIGEDIFTTAFFAHYDMLSLRNRTYFTWRPVLRSDNNRLRILLSKGIAENHFHLKGSAPHFNLTWLSLMTRITEREGEFSELEKDKRLYHYPREEDPTAPRLTLYQLIKLAAMIRVYLFQLVPRARESAERGQPDKPEKNTHSSEQSSRFDRNNPDDLMDLIKHNIHLIDTYTLDIQSQIEACGRLAGRYSMGKLVDYAIPQSILTSDNANANLFLYGERRLMYDVFRCIYSKEADKHNKMDVLFYLYLLIKERLRNELIQINLRPGFDNFALYERRKELFLEGERNSHYLAALYHMAIEGSCQDQNLKSFETRIAPGKTALANIRQIKKIDAFASDNRFYNSLVCPLDAPDKDAKDPSHFYVYHFIKEKEKYNEHKSHHYFVTPRHHRLRNKIKQQALALRAMRDNNAPQAIRFKGIDAANTEIGARAEVFAQVFRMLSEHSIINNSSCISLSDRIYLQNASGKNKHQETTKNMPDADHIPKLHITYHAGEDYHDIVGGLRAIDEAVMFLNIRRGDRLGHALALGIEPEQYYEKREYALAMPAQILLDNIVWMICKLREFAIADYINITPYLETLYCKYFSEIYLTSHRELKEVPPYHFYYCAWKLRGDDPFLYQDITMDNFVKSKVVKDTPALTFWERCGKNPGEEYNTLRNDFNVCRLYKLYHFSPDVRKNGEKVETFHVTREYINAVVQLQNAMQHKIAQLGIGIETNPSSNYMIGRFGDYAEHPIVKFFNLGLTYDPELLKKCPQLMVSINTDDQGVFNTYLENEYALLAIALHKKKNPDGTPAYNDAMIYDWLDRIRQMGLEQSFK